MPVTSLALESCELACYIDMHISQVTKTFPHFPRMTSQIFSWYVLMGWYFLFTDVFSGTPSPKLFVSHLSWHSFLCLMFLSSGLFYFVTGLFCLSWQWGAKSHTWSNSNIFLSTSGSRWDSYISYYLCAFSNNFQKQLCLCC